MGLLRSENDAPAVAFLRGLVATLLIGSPLVGLFLAGRASRTATAQPRERQIRVLESAGDPKVLVAISYEACDNLCHALGKREWQVRVLSYLLSGDAFGVEAGTRVELLNGGKYPEVRVLDGKFAGRVGYTYHDWLRRP